ncbi:MAG: hypothetical protein V4850_08460 [Myxococcota bacterium]
MTQYLFAVSLIGAVACTGTPDEKDDTGAEPDTDTVAPLPSVTAAFTPSTVVAGESAQLDVWIENYVVVDPTGRPRPEATAGEGHYHVYLDGNYTAHWTPYVTIQTAAEDPAGDYVYRVTLVDSDHIELDPPVDTEVTLTIE